MGTGGISFGLCEAEWASIKQTRDFPIMSFFPSADPDEEQTPYAESQPFFSVHHPPTSLSQLPGTQSFDFGLPYATSTHGAATSQSTTWAPAYDTPQGLGLQHPPDSFFSRHAGSTVIPQSNATSFTWPADLTPMHTPATSQCFRRDSCSGNFDPPTTVHPSQLWEPFHPAASLGMARDMSPGRSEYSTSSYQSTTSSPYVHSDSYPAAAASPMVKVESEAASANPAVLHSGLLLQEPPSIHVRDFAASSARRSQQSSGRLSASASDAGDIKPSLRPGYRRAYSAADTEELKFMGRRKRSLTRPENASCSCDICGKLFQRCYNLKAHMETHDTHRNMPNKCKYPDCGKRFVRRTDLTRHNESVRRPFRNPCELRDC